MTPHESTRGCGSRKRPAPFAFMAKGALRPLLPTSCPCRMSDICWDGPFSSGATLSDS